MSLMEEQKNRIGSFHAESTISDAIPSFLLKTYEILQNDKYIDVICWTRNGEGFIVKKVKQFSENVLPIYFRHSNYTSFVRQLNMYDFHKTRQQNHENAFKNVMFRRGFKHLLKDIQRKDYKKNKENSKETTPNEKITLDKPRELTRHQKQYEAVGDIGQIALYNISEANNELEKKALMLASLKQMPQKQLDVIRLLDILFDAKKLQRDMLEKLNLLKNMSLESIRSNNQIISKIHSSSQKWESRIQCPTTEAKITSFQTGKEDRITTYSTLFASFKQG